MTAKQKVALVAAQYAAKARAMTREGDRLSKVADLLDEEGAVEVFATLQGMGLIDGDGMIVEGESLREQLLAPKTGSDN